MADDVIIIEYKAKIDKLESDLHKLEMDLKGVDNASKKSMNTLEKESKQAATAVNKVDKEVSGLKGKLTDLAGRIPGVFAVQEVLGFGKAIQGASTATGGLSGSMKILKVVFASVGIGIFVTAIASLIAYFKSTEEGGDRLAKIMRIVGAVFKTVLGVFVAFGETVYNIGASIGTLLGSSERITKSTDDWKKSIVDLAGEVADLEDQIAALTFSIDLQNEKIESGIQKNLRALRNRNITLEESLKLIEDTGKKEKEKLSNNNKLLDLELEKERKLFILAQKELTNEDALIQQLGKKGATQDRLARERVAAQTLFDKAVKGEITTAELNDKTKGFYAEEDVKRLTEILKRKELASRESGNLEEKLNNLKDTALDRDAARAKTAKDAEDKANQDRLKRLEEQKKKEDKILNDALDEYAQDAKDRADIDARTREEHENSKKKEIESLKKSDEEYATFAKDKADKEAEERIEREKKELEDYKNLQALKKQALSEAIQVSQTLLNSLNQRKLDNDNAEIESDRSKNNAQTASQLASLEKRKEQGLLSEASFASQKEAILKKAAKQESELKRKAWEAQKRADLTSILISTAVAIAKSLAAYGFTPAGAIAAAAAAAEGAIQYSLVASKQAPKFKEGGEIKGKSHSQGGVHIEAEGGEYITKVSQTRKYKGLLESINSDTVEKYLTTDYLKPLLAKQKKEADAETNMLRSALNLALANQVDTTHLESLTKRNGTVKLGNATDIGKAVAKELKSGSNPRMK